MMRTINTAGQILIERNEGCVLHAYQDCAGVWTIGYGHTGPDVNPRLCITTEQAADLLDLDLQSAEGGVAGALGPHAATDNQFAAMVSLAFNIGIGNFRGSTVLRDHLAAEFAAAAKAFAMWDRAGGQVVPGLVRRRAEEAALYATD